MTCDFCNTDDDISRFDRNYSIVLFYTSEQNRTEELFYTSVDRTDQSIESLRLANLPAINLTTNNTSLADGFSTIDSLILNKRGRWFIESSVIEGASLAYFTEDLPWDRVVEEKKIFYRLILWLPLKNLSDLIVLRRQWALSPVSSISGRGDRVISSAPGIIKIFRRTVTRTPSYFETCAGMDDKERAGMQQDRITATFMLTYVDHTQLRETSYTLVSY